MPKSKNTTKRQNIIVRFFKKLLDPTQYTSIKSLAMLVAMFISIGLAACLGYSMILDVQLDGILNMDLIDAAIFVTCLGSFMTLSSVPKMVIDKVRANRGFPKMPEQTYEDKEEEKQ